LPLPYSDVQDNFFWNPAESNGAPSSDFERDVMARRQDGTTFPVHVSVSELRNESERLFIGVVHDLSRRRALERAVTEAASAQQRFIGQELHDNLSQLIAG